MSVKKTVGVFFGGRSNEHEISVITGIYAANLLRGAGYRVVPVFLPREGGMAAACKAKRVEEFRSPSFPAARLCGRELVALHGRKKFARLDVALNCCHGGAGEDGTLAALLAWNGIPSASPAMAPSAVFMHKGYAKLAARGLDIPVLPSVCVREGSVAAEIGFPAIVKPARLGSSIGVCVAKNGEELRRALSLAFRLDGAALVERYLEGKRDLNCAACRIRGEVRVSPVEEAFSGGELLSFAEKYERSERRSELPARIPEEVAARVREYTRRIYEAFDLTGVVRADFLYADELYFNELNTVPGSLSCYLFGNTLTEARDFLSALVEEARPEPRKEIIVTGILNSGVFTGGKGCKRGRNLV